MKSWLAYTMFAATTALPAAHDPEYLRLGLLEEAHEFLSAYCAMRATELGLQKRLLRGDDEATLAAKRADIDRHRQKAIEELGDVCWYTARAGHSTQPSPSRDGDPICVLLGIDMLKKMSAKDIYWIGNHGGHIVSHGLSLLGVSLADVLTANVAKLTARKEAGTIQGQGDR